MTSRERLAGLVMLYNKHKYEALCIDIETTHYNGNIAVLGAYQPAEGIVSITQLVRGENLNRAEVVRMFAGAKLLLTYNGTGHDIPKIKKAYPGIIEHIPHLDLYELAKQLNLKVGLKFLEGHFQIFRDEPYKYWRRKAIKLWKSHVKGNQKSLYALLKYNANDCVNLHPLAEQLTKKFWKKWIVQKLKAW